MNRNVAGLVVALALGIVGCGVNVTSDAGATPEAGGDDGATTVADVTPDESTRDASDPDAVVTDAAAIDAGSADAVQPDAAPPDAAAPDAVVECDPCSITSIESVSRFRCSRGDGYGPYPVGTDVQLEVRGRSARGSIRGYPSDELVFSTSDGSIATVNDRGVLSFRAPGAVTVTVRSRFSAAVVLTSPAFTAVAATLQRIATVPGAGFTVPVGTRQQFTIYGDFGGGSTDCPIANERGVRWRALPEGRTGWVVGETTGLAESLPSISSGVVTVEASYMGLTVQTNGTVAADCIMGLQLRLAAGSLSSIHPGETAVLEPLVVRNDGTLTVLSAMPPAMRTVSYASSNPFVAEVRPATDGNLQRGIVSPATPTMAGTVTVTASYTSAAICHGRSPLAATQMISVTD